MNLLLQCNPYNSSLDVEQIREQYEKEKATLADMLPKDKSEEEAKKVAEEKAKQWAIIEKELESFDMDDLSPENKVRVIHCFQKVFLFCPISLHKLL